MRILALHAGTLGDLILALPALRALREGYPDSEIIGFSRYPVWRYAPLSIEYRDLETSGIHKFFSSPATDILPRADIVISWMAEGDPAFLKNLALATGASVIAGNSRPAESGDMHVSRHLISSLRSLKINPEPQPVPLLVGSDDNESADKSLNRLGLGDISSLVVIHPGSGARAKCWPSARFAEIAERLQEKGRPVLVLEGPADAAMVAQMQKTSKFAILKDASLGALISILSRCAAYLGNDSGVSHLAAAAGAPTLALFGPTDPRVWAPIGPKVTVISANADCAPCKRSSWSDCNKGDCLNSIAVAKVWDNLLNLK